MSDVENTGTKVSNNFMNNNTYYVCLSDLESVQNFRGELSTLRKNFYESQQKPAKLNVLGEYMGFKSKTKGLMKKRSIRFKKIVDDIHMEEAFRFGKSFVVLRRDLNNNICGKIHYDENLMWIKTEYFEFDDLKNAVVILKPSTRTNAIEKFMYNNTLKNYSSETLYPVEYSGGTVEQSFLDSLHGKSYVLVATDKGDFCYCSDSESKFRVDAIESINLEKMTTLPNWEDKNFTVLENSQDEELEDFESSEAPQLLEEFKDEQIEQAEILLDEEISEDAKEQDEPAVEEDDNLQIDEHFDREYQSLMLEESVISEEDLTLELETFEEETALNETEFSVIPDLQSDDISNSEFFEFSQEEEIRYIKSEDEPPQLLDSGRSITENVHVVEKSTEKIISLGSEKYLYSGKFKNGERHGRGRTSQMNGLTTFDGSYNEGKKDGFGASYYQNGDLSYVGSFKDDVKNGTGISFRESDKAMHITNWQNGKSGKNVALFDTKGELRYFGEIKGGKKQGFGLSLKHENLSVFVGDYSDDKISYGALFNNEGKLIYNGHWKNGKRHGFGTEFDENGEVIYSGQWKDDDYFSGTLYKKVNN